MEMVAFRNSTAPNLGLIRSLNVKASRVQRRLPGRSAEGSKRPGSFALGLGGEVGTLLLNARISSL